ncbi:MAG: hypothetical protein A2284_01525, partial [Deltaproteobacteria bacterium RIFOXYA12_FULL_61_11]
GSVMQLIGAGLGFYLFYVFFLQGRHSKDFRAVINTRNGRLVSEKISTATTFVRRSTGLLNHAGLPRDEALFLSPARRIHTCGMRFPIDLVFVERHGHIVRLFERLEPTRTQVVHDGGRRACAVLELAAGRIEELDLREGDQLQFLPVSEG